MISVRGRPRSLAEIMGQGEEVSGDNPHDLLETMNDEESEAFENCHIQIYLLHNTTDPEEESSNEGESRKRSREEE